MGELYLGKYKVLQVLKESPEVLVLLAEHIQLNSYWIIKKLNIVSDDTYREVEVLKNLRFKGIPLLADVIEEKGQLVIVREYMPGQSLHEYFGEYKAKYNTKGLSEEHVVDIGLKLCTIIQYLHDYPEHPLIFRDLKPGNIIIDQDGNLSLIDFGISRFYDNSKERDTEYLGTKGFASPEQYGFGQSNVTTDVFGIGAVLYFLLTGDDMGKPPYHVDELGSKRQDISLKLVDIVNKSCSLKMERRYQEVGLLMEALSTCVYDNRETRDEIFHNFKGRLLVFEHIYPGGGSTYNSLMMAKACIKAGQHPLVIDISGALEVLEYQMKAYYEGQLLMYEQVPILIYDSYKKDGRSKPVDISQYDCMILDKGHEEISFEFDKKVLWFTSTFLSPWKLDCLEEHILSEDKKWIYLISGCSVKAFSAFKQEYERVNMYHIPYEPFSEDGNIQAFASILMEKGVISCLEKTDKTPRRTLGIPFIKSTRH